MSTIKIGTRVEQPAYFSKEARETHLHVLGLSRQGKSYFLEDMIRQDILNGDGVCVIDPHGELYDNLVSWLAEREIDQFRTIHLVNPSDTNWAYAFNPLAMQGIDPYVRIGAMVKVLQTVWGEELFQTYPLLRKCLRLTFYALAANDLAMTDAKIFTSLAPVQRQARERLIELLPDRAMHEEWRSMIALPRDEYSKAFASTDSRFIEFVTAPVVSSMLGQTDNVVDLRKAMDNQEIVLVNLANKDIYEHESARIIGAMLQSSLFFAAKSRDVHYAKRTPFYCYIDECHEFLTDDVVRSLDQTAKFGLHYVLAHQRLDQLRDCGERVFKGVWQGTQSKIVFKIDDDDTAEELSRFLFRKEFELEKPKESMNKPVVVGHSPVWLHSESTTNTESESETVNESSGDTIAFDVDGEEVGSVEASTESYATVRQASSSETQGRAQTLRPDLEWLPTQLYTIEEQVHLGMVAIRGLPKRAAIAYLADERKPFRFSTRDVQTPNTLDFLVDDFIERVNVENPSVLPLADARVAIEDRHIAVLDNRDLIDLGDAEDDYE